MSKLITYRLLAAGLMFALIGCGGLTGTNMQSNSVLPEPGIAQARAAARRDLCSNFDVNYSRDGIAGKALFVSETGANSVNIYDLKNLQLVRSVTNGVSLPLGVAFDNNGVLYVVNQPEGGSNTVTEYAPGAKTPEQTLTVGETAAIGVVVDSSGTVYVDNDYPAEMIEFAAGSQTPTKTFSLPLAAPWGLAIDKNNNVYVTDLAGAIWEFAAGSTTGTNLGLQEASEPNGVAVDGKGNLYVTNYAGSEAEVLVYRRGHTSPVCTITQGVSNPALLATTASGTLYVANDTPPASVTSYKPGETTPQWTLTQDMNQPFGVALGPGR